MKSERQIKQLAKEIRLKPDDVVDERVLACAKAVLEKSTKNKTAVLLGRPSIWRIIMKNPVIKLSTAALIIVCIALTITFMEKTVTPAYSFEQTLQAIQNLRTMHMVCKDWSGNEFEMWIELNPETGIPDYCRAYWPKSKVLNISRPDTSYQYNENANQVQINSGKLYHMDLAPARVFEQLQQASRQDPDSVVIFHEYDGRSDKSVIVVIWRGPTQSFKVYIDPDTKLPVRMQGLESNQLGSVIKDIEQIEFNIDLPENIFAFEIPEGASIINHDYNQKLLNDPQNGISTEGMTEQQAAETIATMYWNALIEMDKATAQTVAPVSPHMVDSSLLAELVEVGRLYIQPGCGIGKLIPCRLRYADGSLKEWKLIIKHRNIDGRPSCVIAGFYASPVEIESAR